jgi:hypothetical protein
VCLYAQVRDGRGEGVIFLAAGEAQFLAHLATVDQMIHRSTVAPVVAEQKPTMKPNIPNAATQPPTPGTAKPSATDDASAAGLYLATTQQFRLNPFGSPGSGSWEARTEYYLLSRDGRVFRGRDLPNAPDGDINRFDYAAAQREAPGNYGTYSVHGDRVDLRLGDAPIDTISASRIDADTLEIRGTKFKRGIRGK